MSKRPMLLAIIAAMLAGASPLDRALLAGRLAALVEKGSAEAAYHLGMMKHLGIGGEKDEEAALELFRKASDAGDPLAAYMLGDAYAKGVPGQIEPDKAEALRLKSVAAEAGYALAQHDVARLYFESGQIDLALEWLLRAANQGQTDALRALASLHNSDAMPKDAARTYAYYTLYLARLAAPTGAQRTFLAEFTSKMSAEDKRRGEDIIANLHPEMTELTRKAQSGLRAAEALVAAPGR